MTDLLRGYSTTTTRVHTEHHGLDVIVISQFAQVFCCGLSHDAMSAAIKQIHGLTIYDTAIGIVDGNLLAVVILLRLYVEHIAQGELVNVVVLAEFQTLLNLCLNLFWEHHLVDQLGFHIILGVGKSHDAVVSQLVQGFGFYFTTLSHLLQPVVPDTRQVGGALLAVVVAHTCLGIALHIALILTNLGHHIFNAEFVVQTLHILTLGTKALEIDITMIIQVDVVGNRSHIIGGLVVPVGIGNDPLAALLEVTQGIAQLLGCGR